MTQDYLPFPEIVEQLEKLVRQRVTGTLFLATKANRSAQIMLESGEIVFVYFYNKRGEAAVELMKSIVAGRLRFQAGQVVGRKQDLPPTPEILDRLKQSTGHVEEVEQKPEPAGGQSELTDEQKKIVESCLAEFIGPMAAIICEEQFSAGGDPEKILGGLAAEIPGQEQTERFLTMARSRLGL